MALHNDNNSVNQQMTFIVSQCQFRCKQDPIVLLYYGTRRCSSSNGVATSPVISVTSMKEKSWLASISACCTARR
jgi:hypothetical protein